MKNIQNSNTPIYDLYNAYMEALTVHGFPGDKAECIVKAIAEQLYLVKGVAVEQNEETEDGITFKTITIKTAEECWQFLHQESTTEKGAHKDKRYTYAYKGKIITQKHIPQCDDGYDEDYLNPLCAKERYWFKPAEPEDTPPYIRGIYPAG